MARLVFGRGTGVHTAAIYRVQQMTQTRDTKKEGDGYGKGYIKIEVNPEIGDGRCVGMK